MEKIDWNILSNSEIQLKQLVLKENYESVKNRIGVLFDELDVLDSEYINSEKVLNKRFGKINKK